MQVGIIGLPLSGKTTVFNALTGSTADTAMGGKKDPNRGVCFVPDPRLEPLTKISKSKKTTYSTIELTDVAGLTKGAGKEKGFSNQFLGQLRDMEALLLVVRVFESETVPHTEGAIDPVRDLEILLTELILADMTLIENRLPKAELMKTKDAQNRKVYEKEEASLRRFMAALEDSRPIMDVEPTEEEMADYVHAYGLLTAREMLVLANVGDLTHDREQASLERLRAETASKGMELVVMNAQLETEVHELPEEEWQDYFEACGLEGSGKSAVISACYCALRQQSFLTTGEDESRAWTIPIGAKAPQAAGKIHTDIERGFIRAEVVTYNDLIREGSIEACKKAGKYRLEGKDYVVQDGDVINFRFAV
ncbi:MAG TPA: redox-regulated ATPase YchF [bacterium]|nr:redox-regulated ATPase YchF [bacterium]